MNIIGNGVVLDPILFRQEAEALAASGHDLTRQLYISKKAHLIMPTHRILDAAYEAAKGDAKVGTTGKGIGPTYTDKVSRNGLRVGDLLSGFDEKYAIAKRKHEVILKGLGYPYDITDLEKEWFEALEYLKRFQFIDSEHVINHLLDEGKSILAEGAQGTMLDVDFGSYPFVTSSNTVCAGACVGLGVAPRRIGEVYGIFKAYCTRVGAGPFPTELFDETGDLLGERGHEFGAVTGRKRRCGWIDLVALRYAVMINGVTRLIMMKSDVLDTFDTVKACVAYKIGGKETEDFPFDICEGVEPVYVELPGWKTDLTRMTSEDEFPEEFRILMVLYPYQKISGRPIAVHVASSFRSCFRTETAVCHTYGICHPFYESPERAVRAISTDSLRFKLIRMSKFMKEDASGLEKKTGGVIVPERILYVTRTVEYVDISSRTAAFR